MSIVLIIIGLLVAGVSGGKSLIEGARIIQSAKEFREMEMSFFSFYDRYKRLPGDIDNNGYIGYKVTNTNSTSSLLPNFSGSKLGDLYTATEINAYAGPWAELCVKKMFNYCPPVQSGNKVIKYWLPAIFNISRTISSLGTFWSIFKTSDEFNSGTLAGNFTLETTYSFHLTKNKYLVYSMESGKYSPTLIQRIDIKLDDGTYNRGKFRGNCNNKITNYETAIINKTKCVNLLFLFDGNFF